MFVLLAALDWLSMIVPIVFFLYAIFQLFSSRNAPQGRNQPRRPPPQPAERVLRPKPAKQGGPQAQLNAEIEQFLRRAGEQRERSLQTAAPVAPPQQRPVQRMPAVRTLQSEPPPPPQAARTSVAESVEKHLSTSTFANRADHLADDVIVAEAQLERHIKDAFSHKVGTLDTTGARTAERVTDIVPEVPIAAPGAAIAAMLADRQSIKQAFVLSEIIRRPVERW